MKTLIISLTVLTALTAQTITGNNIKHNNLINKHTMEDKSFTTTIEVDKSPEEVFNAVNNVRGWWSEQVTGSTDKPNAEFDYHYKDVHRCKMKIVEFVPGKKVVWLVLENYFNFVTDQSEWKGTKVTFEITKHDGKTQLKFTHVGLLPAHQCYKICSDAWGHYINDSLKDLIEKGKGEPNPYIPAIEGAEAQKAANKQ